MRLFVVDDSLLLRERLGELIAEIPGAELVGFAESVVEAATEIGKSRPEVVILDLGLSDGYSLDLLREIKGLESPPKVIVFTEYDSSQHRKVCFGRGADFFLGKTAEFEQLETILRGLLSEAAQGG